MDFNERNAVTAGLRTVKSLSSNPICTILVACSFVSHIALAVFLIITRRRTTDSEENSAIRVSRTGAKTSTGSERIASRTEEG